MHLVKWLWIHANGSDSRQMTCILLIGVQVASALIFKVILRGFTLWAVNLLISVHSYEEI